MNSLQNESYLNRVALVGCESQELSKAYAKQFYTLKHLRGAIVTGRVGDMQINPDGSKTMAKNGQKTIHNWDYEGKQPVWQTIDAKRTGKILKSLKLGLGDTPSNIPDSLDYNDIGNKEGDGIMKTAYTLKDHPNLLFLQLDTETPLKVEKLEHEIAWINKMRELGIKTPEYYKAIVMTDQNHQKHHGILVERIPDAKVIRPDSPNLMKNKYITRRTLDDIRSLSDKFEQNPDLYIPDLQMLMGKDGQLYVFDPGSADSPMHQPDSPANQIARSMNMKELKKLNEKATLFLGKFNESNRMHAIFVDEALLKKDPNLEEKLINKAKKQQDLAIFSYNFEGMLVEPTLLYQPDNSQPIDRIEVMADKGNRSPNQIDMSFLTRDMPNISNDMIFRCRPAENFSNYRTNIIVQHGNSDTAIKAAQDLANKHPDNSIIVHFDADNKLVTSNNEFYTPKGNVRLSFVDHGGNFVTDESNMDNLIDKVKQITDTYGNENTYFERIALVGCDTDGVGKTLTKDFARAVYSDIPTLRNADITGRAGEVQVNDDGTKTMKTGGAKTVYSWDEAVEGNIKERSETVKRYSDSLENPLGKFDDQIREIDRLLDIKPMSESTEKILTDTRNALLEINLAYHTAPDNLSHIVSLLARHELKLKAYLDEHEDTQVKKSLEAFCDSLNIQGNNIQFEIDAQLSKEFSEILKWAPENQTLKLIAFHEKLLSKKNQYSQLALLTHQSLKEVKRSVSATLDKVEDIANKASTLDAEEKIKALAEANKYINYLHANLKYFKEADQTRVKEFKTKILPPLELSTWHRTKVVNTYRVPLVDDNAFRIVVQLSGDTDTANGAAYLAGKHFGNSTLVQIDKYGNYKVVHGPELKDIPDGKKAKFVFLGHGNSIKKTMGGRVASDMAKHILDLKLVIPKTVDITAVAIKGCCAGADYGKDILTELNKEKFRPLVTSKPGHTKVDHSGRQLTDGIYHSEDNRTAWKYNKDNKIVTIPYSDDKHHIVLAIDEHGEPKVIKTHDNKNWKEFKGELRVRIVAGGRMKTVDALMEFQEQLRDQGATMRQIDIEMGDQNWVGDSSTALHDYGGYARSMSDFIESNIAFHLDSGAHEGSTIFSYKDAPNREQLVFNPGYSIKSSDTCLSDRITLDYDKDNRPLLLTSTESDSDIFLSIYIGDADYKKEWVLSQLQKAKEVAGNSSILKVRVLTNTKYLMPIKDGRDLVNYLSQELEVRTEARHKGVNDSQFRLLLSKNPGDSEVKMEHLAETTSHRNIPLHNWGDLSQEQINKLAAESQRTKPSLVNHDYQVLIQTEADDNVKDSTLKLASKHPTQTTIVQMQKDGTYKVVYGLELKDIIGKVKMVAVGYGREKNGVQTLGGRNESELSDNILTLKRDLNPTNTTIGRTSLVGCNLESNNPTNNPDSQYGKQVIQRLHQGGINGDLSVRSSYVGIQPDGTKVTSNTGVDNWKHKDSEAKTVYSYDKNGKVESKVYDGNGVLVKYNGQHLDGTRYKSNVIVQNSDNTTVIEAANALFNKHPNTSVIVKFDQNGNLVTLKGEAYTPTGDIRINFVDHGTNLSQEGAQSLADKARILQQTYGNSDTKIKRMALVGCDTDGVDQSLTRNFAHAVYNDTPALKQTEITGRTGQVQVNTDGTKTMTTDGAKTIYSWDNDKGGIARKIETVKRYSDILENPLNDLNDQIKEIEKLLKSEQIQSSEQSKHRNTLVSTLNVLYEAQKNGLEASFDKLKQAKENFYAHLKENPSTRLKKIYSPLESLTLKVKNQILERTDRESHALALSLQRQNQDAQTLEVGQKIEKLKDVYNQFVELSKNNPEMRQWAEENRLNIGKQIQLAQEFQAKITKMGAPKVAQGGTDVLVKYKHQVIVSTDPMLSDELLLAGKYPDNTTIIATDIQGNYKVIYGPKLDQIPKGELKVVVTGHGSLRGIRGRSVGIVAQHVATVSQAIHRDSSIAKVSLVACNLGGEYAKNLLLNLQKKGIVTAAISVRLGNVSVFHDGRKIMANPESHDYTKYRSNTLKETYALNKQGEIIFVDSYLDEHYDVILSVDEDGTPKIENIYGNKAIHELQGKLKIRVKAGSFDATKSALQQFENKLPSGVSMAQINIKIEKDNNWFTQHDVWKQGENLDTLNKDFGANIMAYFNPEDGQPIRVIRNNGIDTSVTMLQGISRFIRRPNIEENRIRLTEYNSIPVQRILEYSANAFDDSFVLQIEHTPRGGVPTIKQSLDSISLASEVAQKHAIAYILISVPESVDINHYKTLVDTLSETYKVEVDVWVDLKDGTYKEWLSKNPEDSEVKVEHLAKTTPHQNTPLHNWTNLSQEQINKLALESQKTKPSLANHDHQVLIQTEADDNVKDNTSRLASKHPTQTTIVQMQKDGTYKVVCGAKLENITGRVKMVAVGYGREKNGVQTLGGRNESELSDNILTLKRDLNPTNTTIGRTSLVGCNLESNNPTNNPDSQYGKQVIQRLHQGGINGDLSVRSSYVGIQLDGTKVTSNTGVDNWKHKDSEAKTVYSYDKNGKVESKVYDGNGVLVKYNGQHLDGTRYKSNVIVQNSDNTTVIEAANALFNKHPNTSVIVKFDQNGNLVTLKGEAYTPTGDIRINFVDHGTNLSQEGAQSLADKARILQQTYGNSDTKIKRMALVGCDTDGVDQSLTRNFAHAVYNDTPALKQTEITGRTGQVQVNTDGTKTMTTDGAKTIYSWDNDKGGIARKIETVKRYSDILENPLNDLNDQIKEIEKLLKSEQIQSSEQSKHRNTLVSTLNVLYEAQKNGLEASFDKLKQAKENFYAHLKENPSTRLKKIYSPLESLTLKVKNQILERTDRESHALALSLQRQNQDAQTLEVGQKIEKLKDVYNQFVELSKNNPEMRQWAEENRLNIGKQIQLAQEFQAKITKMGAPKVAQGGTDVLVKYKHQVIVSTDPMLSDELLLAGKYPDNTTIIATDIQGNYKVIYGPKLDQIPKGELKVVVTGHGSLRGIRGRSVGIVAQHVATVSQAIHRDSSIAKVSLVACNLGGEYAKNLLLNLQKKGIVTAAISVRLGNVSVFHDGRKIMANPESHDYTKYRSNTLKETYALNKQGEIIFVDSYLDEHYDVILSVDEDGTPKIENIYGNKAIHELQGKLKIRVKAGSFDATKSALQQFENKLPSGVSMAQINIKIEKDNNWFTQHDVWKQGENLDTLNKDFGANIMAYFNPEDGQPIRVIRNNGIDTSVTMLQGISRFIRRPNIEENRIRLTEYNSIPVQRILEYSANAFDDSFVLQIEHTPRGGVPTIKQTLDSISLASEVAQKHAIAYILISVPESVDINHYKTLVDTLSETYKVEVDVWVDLKDGTYKEWLSKNPEDSEVKVEHLAKTTPHQNTPLHNWTNLSQEQINKLALESQKTKPSLANHDHQVLIQTEADDNVKDNTSRLASKHPTQTTIVQMQKDGTYKVVCGAKLENITGRVKMVAVGYGREKNGVQTLGGRNESELSDNILTL
ncbi:C80 family cysteine peptidase, partial [Bathymodiolus thermophilus thioautotrophic gill symbiont]|uniref:C80 family cysteine peptidase n=1 Tax=Bathymodiolus thermophilus thioautotrophic gill symbiont TaxID=2360 RepID=UPI00192AFD57